MEGCKVKRNEREIKSIKLDTENLCCEKVYDELRTRLLAMEGIVDVDADMKSKKLFIDYDVEKANLQEITKITEEYGCKPI